VIRFSNTVEIARPTDEVFDYLADLEHTSEWNWAVTSSRKMSAGSIGVGSRFQQTRSVPRPAVETLEITRLDPGTRLEVVGELASLPAHLTYELSRSAAGTTLTNSVELEPTGVLGLIGGLVAGRIQASVAQNLTELKALLEEERSHRR
jgi:uncharacterized protein YndB with AHSA1/START domain